MEIHRSGVLLLMYMFKNVLKVVAIIFVLVAAAWYFGYFTSYNSIIARRDIRNGIVRFITVGIPLVLVKQTAIDSINRKYGVVEENVGCIVTPDEIRGIDSYNKVMEEYLENRNGEGWEKRYQKEKDSILTKK